MHVYHMCAWYLRRAKDSIGSPGTSVTNSYESPCGCWAWLLYKNSRCSKPLNRSSIFCFKIISTADMLSDLDELGEMTKRLCQIHGSTHRTLTSLAEGCWLLERDASLCTMSLGLQSPSCIDKRQHTAWVVLDSLQAGVFQKGYWMRRGSLLSAAGFQVFYFKKMNLKVLLAIFFEILSMLLDAWQVFINLLHFLFSHFHLLGHWKTWQVCNYLAKTWASHIHGSMDVKRRGSFWVHVWNSEYCGNCWIGITFWSCQLYFGRRKENRLCIYVVRSTAGAWLAVSRRHGESCRGLY